MSRLLSSLIMDVDDRLLLLPGLEEQLLEAGPVCPLLPAEGAKAQPRGEAWHDVTPRPLSTLIGSSHLLSDGPYEIPLSPSRGDSLADTIDLAKLVDEMMGNSMDGLPCINSMLEPMLQGMQDDATELDHTKEELALDVGVSSLFSNIEDMDLMELSELDLLESSSWMGPPTSPIASSLGSSSITSNNSIVCSSSTDSDIVSTIEVSREIDNESKVNSDINNSGNNDVSGWISHSDLQSQFAKCSGLVGSGVGKSYDPCSSSGYSSDTSDRPDSQMLPDSSVISSAISSSADIASSSTSLLGQQLLTVAAMALSSGCERRLRKKQQNQRAAVRYRQRKRTEHDTLKGTMSGEQARNRQLRERVDALGKELLYLRGLLKELYGTSLPKLPDDTHKGT